MLNNYFKRKSKLAIAIDIIIGIGIILILIPATRKQTAALILKPTLFIHQPRVKAEKEVLKPDTYNWQLQDMTGERISLNDFKGKVVFINIWATWCPPCLAEMDDLQKLYSDYGEKVTFLFVSNENAETLKTFLEKKKYTIPTYIPLTQYPDDFQTTSIPTTFLINKKGEIVIARKGVAKWNSQRIRGVLDVLINQ